MSDKRIELNENDLEKVAELVECQHLDVKQ